MTSENAHVEREPVEETLRIPYDGVFHRALS